MIKFPFLPYLLLVIIIIFSLYPESNAKQTEASNAYLQYIEAADSCIKESDWEKAETMILSALRTDPSNQSNMLLFSNLGNVRLKQNNIAGALEAFDAALCRAPRSTVILGSRASTLIQVGRNDEALEDLNTALSVDSTLIWHRTLRANILLEKNDIASASYDFDHILLQDSSNIDALGGMAKCLLRTDRPELALQNLEKAIKQEKREDLFYTKILTQIRLNQLSEARKTTLSSINIYPDYSEFYVLLAYCNKLLHLNDEAEAALHIARRIGADESFIRQFFPTNKQSTSKK